VEHEGEVAVEFQLADATVEQLLPWPMRSKRIRIDRSVRGRRSKRLRKPGRLSARSRIGRLRVGAPTGQLNWTIRSTRSGVAAAERRAT
jgi:hypothetical protein